MTDTAAVLLVATLAVAAANWFAVGTARQKLEYVCKPLTMVVLIGAALAIDPDVGSARAWFVVALAFSLAGDVFLMLRRDLFVAGLASFLLGHLAYVGGLWSVGLEPGWTVGGIAVVAIAVPTLGRRIRSAIRYGEEPELLAPVLVYIAVISAMVVSAAGTGSPIAFAGAVSFYASDALIAWNRFIQEYPWGRVAIMVTYHLAQVALVLSLA